MAELKVNITDDYRSMLESLKPVAEAVIEEPLDFDTYVNVVLIRGMKAMIEDIVPKDSETLFKSIVLMYERNPDFVASFITDMLAAGEAREEAKERLGFIKDV